MQETPEHSGSVRQRFTFPKEERLCSKKIIDQVFATGESFLSYPLKVVYLKNPGAMKKPLQAGFSVAKKNFKRAVQRNRIKRLMRETYRLNKPELYRQSENVQLAVFFIFIGKSMPSYAQVEQGMKNALLKLDKAMQHTNLHP